MPIGDFAAWRDELLFTGRIVQDGDHSVDPNEAHRRFLRYCELVEELDGSEGPEAIAALFQSVQMKHDYGAYQTTYRVMGRFPDKEFIEVFVHELPSLIERLPDWAGDFLVGVANGQGGKWDYQIGMFNDAVASSPPATRAAIVNYVRSQETSGWFEHRVGVLCPGLK
jgi:hypothetical protein